jgi:hypothetical protein
MRTGATSRRDACLQHLVLRVLLWQDDCTPGLRKYVSFLDYAAERIPLCRDGGRYISCTGRCRVVCGAVARK